MSTELVVDDLSVVYGGVRPLSGVSLTFSGEVCGLIGPNGAGKTTFFNVLSGFAAAATGTVTVAGDDLLGMSPAARARWGLRRTFQQEQVIHTLSAYDNIRLLAEHTTPGESTRAAIDAAIEFVGLEEVDRPGDRLSMLERRLVEIAKSVCGSPRLILLDEPAAGLDANETEVLVGLIRRIPEAIGALVVLVDHDMDLVSTVCGTTAVLDFGEVIALGSTAEVLTSPAVKAAYLGTVDVDAA